MCLSFQVLIADRDVAIRDLLIRIITRTHPTLTITAVADGNTALQFYQQCGADLLLTGGIMPGMDGLALTSRLRAEGAKIPIILLSGSPRIRQQASLAGATVFLPKPFKVEQLLLLLAHYLPVSSQVATTPGLAPGATSFITRFRP